VRAQSTTHKTSRNASNTISATPTCGTITPPSASAAVTATMPINLRVGSHVARGERSATARFDPPSARRASSPFSPERALIAAPIALLAHARRGRLAEDPRDTIIRREPLDLRVGMQREPVAKDRAREALHVVGRHELAPL